MTKKSFNQDVSYHNYGKRNGKIALFYDWQTGDYEKGERWRGYKWMVYCRKENATKKELMDIFYQWVNGIIDNLPYYIDYKFAITDDNRFKVPITL
jgi:hypothetical protein